jgi:4-diphosphocytidyl-2-C-methyl-D-erythritol kinase
VGRSVESLAAPALRIVVAPFDFRVSTAEAFAWWDEDGGVTGDPVDGVAEALGGAVGPISNDLQGPVARRHPRVSEGVQALLDAGAVRTAMSGSGPTIFGLLPGDEPLAPDTVRAVRHVTGKTPVVCTTLPGGE